MMKRIQDEQGTQWTVYGVTRYARLTGRTINDFLPPTYSDGWLVFQSTYEKRRLAPFPGNWTDLPDETLRAFLATATPVRPSGGVLGKDVEEVLRQLERSSLSDK